MCMWSWVRTRTMVSWFCEVSVFCLSCYLSAWWTTASSTIYILHFFDFLQWLEININQGPYLLKKAYKLELVGFFEKCCHLTVLWMVLNESSCNFCFLIATPSHIYSEKFLILIYYPKMFSFNQNQLVLVSHTQLWLDQSDSKILETPITQKKFRLFSFVFA